MTKREISVHVNIYLDQLMADLNEMGAELSADFVERIRQILEGMAIKEMAARERG